MTTDRTLIEVALAECAEVCTSGCHSDICEHHDLFPTIRAEPRAEGLREAIEHLERLGPNENQWEGAVRPDPDGPWLDRGKVLALLAAEPGAEPG